MGLADQRDQAALDHGSHFIAIDHAAHDDHELVASQAAHRVAAAHGLGQAVGHRAQQPIPDVVAERIVDVLEAVQVDEQHRHALARLLGFLQRLSETADAQRAVGQLGEHIVFGVELHPGLGAFAVGDVHRDADVV